MSNLYRIAMMIILGGALGLSGCRQGKPAEAPKAETKITTTDGGKKSASSQSNGKGKSSSKSVASDSGRSAEEEARLEAEPTTGPAVLVHGRITLPDGKPAANATVSLMGYVSDGRPGYTKTDTLSVTTTDDNGNYKVRGEGDIYSIWLQLEGDLPNTDIRDFKYNTLGGNAKRGLTKFKRDIILARSAELKGRVINEKGEPMPDLAVLLKPIIPETQRQSGTITDTRSMKELVTTSTATGDFVFDRVVDGQWTIGTTAKDYAPVVKSIDTPTSEPLTLQLSSHGGTVNGRVMMKKDASPVEGMGVALVTYGSSRLSLEGQTTTSSQDGSFKFEHVSTGSMTLLVKGNGDPGATLGIVPPGPGTIKVEDGETTDVTLFLYSGYTVKGLVFDKDTSEPLSGAKVTAGPGKNGVESDAEGHYTLPNVFAQGNIQIYADLKSFKLSTGESYQNYVSASLPADESTPIVKDLPMVRLLNISGKVVTKDGSPVGHAMVGLMAANDWNSQYKRIPVNSDGTFKLEGTPFSSALVVAEAKGFGRAMSEPIELTTEDKSDVVVTMEAGATVSGRVVDPDGQPVAGAEIQNMQMYQLGGSGSFGMGENLGQSGQDGSFTLTDQPVTMVLSADKKGYASTERLTLSLKPGETKSGVELKLRASESISGIVVKKDGSPIPSLQVNAQGNDSYGNASTDKDGKFEIKNLAPGTYRVYVFGSGKTKTVENVKSGTTDLRIEMDEVEGVKLIGTVLDDSTGEPIRDFSVSGLPSSKNLKEPGKFEGTGLTPGAEYSLKITVSNGSKQTFKVMTPGDTKEFQQTFRVGKGGVITGKVIEKASGKPLANIPVINWGDTSYYQRSGGPINHNVTNEDGTFNLAPAPAGKNVVAIRPAAPLVETFKSVEVKSEDIADLGEIAIGVGGSIKGKVSDRAGKGMAGKKVNAYLYSQENSINKQAQTDEEGLFEFAALPEGSFTVSCSSQSKLVPLKSGETGEANFTLGGVKMTGQVLRGTTPVTTSVNGTGPDGETYNAYAQGGKYIIADMPPGEYEFKVDTLRETVQVPDQAEFQKDFQLPNGVLKVTVIDGTGQPVKEAKVTVALKNSESGVNLSWETRSKNETTGVDGTATIEGLTAGVYSVTAYKNEMGSASNPNVQLSNNQTGEVKLTLEGGGGTLVSVALKSSDGQPMANAWCYLYGPDGLFGHGAQRGADGVMTIRNIPPGTYRTNVSAWNYSQSERTVEVKAGETVTIEDVCYAAGSIQWVLKKADGKPAAGANVTVTPISTEPPDHARTGVSDNNGNFEDRGLASGTYQVTAQLPGKSAVSEVFEVKAGGHTKKDLVVQGW